MTGWGSGMSASCTAGLVVYYRGMDDHIMALLAHATSEVVKCCWL